ncbi:MAG: hypothetical protein ACTSPQ_11545 [Candidatus Helarchaeota archaeon]
MDIKLQVVNIDTIDCTSDPHYISLNDIETIFDILLDICKSDLIRAIFYVKIIIIDKDRHVEKWDCDYYMNGEFGGGDQVQDRGQGQSRRGRQAKGLYAKKHKIEGLYFVEENTGQVKLPPGLTGLKAGISKLRNLIKEQDFLNNKIKLTIYWNITSHNYSKFITKLNQILAPWGVKVSSQSP